VIVDVNEGHVAGVRRLIVDCARWADVSVDLSGIDEETDMLRTITDAIRPVAQDAEGRLLALRVRLEGQTSLHRRLKADSRTFTDEVQAAAHRCHEDIWLERLQIETKEPSVPTANQSHPEALIDLGAMLAGLEHDPNIHARAAEIVAIIADRLPAGIVTGDIPLADDLDKLLGDAGALVLGRTMRQQES
jgi:hypothetical protein